MKKIKNILFLLLVVMVMIPFGVNAEGEKPAANKEPVKIYFFHGETCPHCLEAFEWFDSIEEEYGDYFDIAKYEVWNDAENSALMKQVASFNGDNPTGVPYIIVGNYSYVNGFGPDAVIDESTGKTEGDQMIERILETYESDNRYDVMEAYNNRPDYSTVVGIVSIVVIVGIVAIAIITRRGNKED